MNLSKLREPFDPAKVHWRVGSTTKDKTRGMAMAYLNARDVMERLDEVCGPHLWSDKYEVYGNRVICSLGIYMPLCTAPDDDHGDACYEWVWKSDGAGDTDYEAEKGAISDAFKRAAVKWGIGRYLYEIKAPWVQVIEKGKSVFIAEHELSKLQMFLPGSTATTASTVHPEFGETHPEKIEAENPGIKVGNKADRPKAAKMETFSLMDAVSCQYSKFNRSDRGLEAAMSKLEMMVSANPEHWFANKEIMEEMVALRPHQQATTDGPTMSQRLQDIREHAESTLPEPPGETILDAG